MRLNEPMLERFALNVERALDTDMLTTADAMLVESLLDEVRALLHAGAEERAKQRMADLLRMLESAFNADTRILIDASFLETIRHTVLFSGDTTD